MTDPTPTRAEELVPCPAHLCGSDIGFCGLCGTAGAVTKATADDYLRAQRRTTVLEVPPMSDEDREELMQLARREAGALLVMDEQTWSVPPVEERPDGFTCLGFIRGRWEQVRYSATYGGWQVRRGGGFFHPDHFAPLPKTP